MGHPLSGLLLERKLQEVLLEEGWGKRTGMGMPKKCIVQMV